MKLPNGYGSTVKLSGSRQRPYVVRILTGYSTNETSFKVTPKYKYLEYFYRNSYRKYPFRCMYIIHILLS